MSARILLSLVSALQAYLKSFGYYAMSTSGLVDPNILVMLTSMILVSAAHLRTFGN